MVPYARFLSRLGLAVALLTLVSCAQSDADKIADAQYCLDQSTQDTALGCMSKVNGLDSPASDLVRCSAYFIDQGFSSAERLSKISKELENDDNSGSSTIAVLSFMAFSASKYDMSSNYSLSETAFGACTRSKSAGLIYLLSLTRIATATLKTLNSFDPTSGVLPTEAEVKEALCGPSGTTPTTDPALTVVIGGAAQVAYDANCKGKDPGEDQVCDQYAAAIAAGDTPEEIGAQLASDLCAP